MIREFRVVWGELKVYPLEILGKIKNGMFQENLGTPHSPRFLGRQMYGFDVHHTGLTDHC
jgi:hypothetical protein